MSAVKVMHVIASMDLGGAQKLTRLIVEGLSREEFAASVCCLKAGGFYADQLRQSGCPVWILLNVDKHGKSGPLDLLRVAWRLFCLLRRERPQILHSHLFLPSTLVRVVGLLAGARCFVVTTHRLQYQHIEPLVERMLTRFTTRYVTDSKAAAGFITNKLGVKENKVEVIYNGIDITEFNAPPTRVAARVSLGVRGEEFVIGMVAHLSEAKGHAFLLESLANIRHALGRFRLLVVGDGPLRPRLEAMAAAQFEAGQVVFLGQRGDLANLLAAMDLLVLPASWEGFGIILAEAMYMRIPVITTSDGGGCAEVVEQDNGGALVPFGNTTALGKAILRFYGGERLRVLQGAKGRARVEQHFVSKIMVEKYAAMYRRACAAPGRR